MTRYLVPTAIFLAGLAVLGWIGAGYAGANPLALAVTLLIGLFYLAGALELRHYHAATRSLARAAAGGAPGADLNAWLEQLPAGLRHPVRLRIDGVRVGLPAPALTPYLVGLLVLLGMLGTFLGMVATLRGTGAALQSATDLQAMRASLAAPVQGLGFAFGTSVAGVAASAMLGLLAALCRRERLHASQALDARIATGLRAHSPAHQREQVVALLQRQAEALPAMLDRLQALAADMAQQNLALQERIAAGQDSAQARADASHERLVRAVEQVLQSHSATGGELAQSLDSALRHNNAASERVLQSMEQALRENAEAGAGLAQSLARTLHENSAAQERVIQSMNQALQENASAGQRLARTMEETLQAHARTLDQSLQGNAAVAERLAQILDQALQAHADTVDRTLRSHTETLERTLQEHAASGARVAGVLEQALQANASTVDQTLQAHARTLDQTLQAHDAAGQRLAGIMEQAVQDTAAAAVRAAGTAIQPAVEATMAALARETATLHEAIGQSARQQIEGIAARLDSAAAAVAGQWDDALARQRQAGDALAGGLREALAHFTSGFDSRIDGLLRDVEQSHRALQSALAAQDERRLQAWGDALGAMAAGLRGEWERLGAQAEARHQALGESVAHTARELAGQTQAHARDTMAEVARLVETAAQAPRAAAEAIEELRRSLSAATERDNAMLAERARLLQTLDALLGDLTHAGAEQRAAVDALLARAGELLAHTGTRVAEHVGAEAGKLSDAAAHVTGSAVEIASLGEAFGAAVQSFGQSSAQLAERLQGIEAALDKAMVRSDEQLAYYVAQAREVVDLSVLSQKQIIEDLRQLAARQAGTTDAAEQ